MFFAKLNVERNVVKSRKMTSGFLKSGKVTQIGEDPKGFKRNLYDTTWVVNEFTLASMWDVTKEDMPSGKMKSGEVRQLILHFI